MKILIDARPITDRYAGELCVQFDRGFWPDHREGNIMIDLLGGRGDSTNEIAP